MPPSRAFATARRDMVALLETALSIFDPCELAQRAIGHDDRPRTLGRQLLHGLAHPPGCISPERNPEVRIKAFERPEHADDAILNQITPVDRVRPAIDAGDPRDRGHEGLDQLLTLSGAALLGSHDHRALVRRG